MGGDLLLSSIASMRKVTMPGTLGDDVIIVAHYRLYTYKVADRVELLAYFRAVNRTLYCYSVCKLANMCYSLSSEILDT